MEETKEFLKKYWPYVIGGIVGLYIVLKYMGGSSSSSSSDPYTAYMTAQTQLQAQNAQIAAQQQSESDQVGLANAQINMQNNANYANAFNAFQTSQAAMASSLGTSVSQVITALNTPAITALQAGAIENSAALTAAGNVAANSFLAQGQVSQGTSNMFASALANLGKIGFSTTGQQPKSGFSQAVDSGVQAYAAYQTGGMSTMMQNMNSSPNSSFTSSPSGSFNYGINPNSIGTYGGSSS